MPTDANNFIHTEGNFYYLIFKRIHAHTSHIALADDVQQLKASTNNSLLVDRDQNQLNALNDSDTSGSLIDLGIRASRSWFQLLIFFSVKFSMTKYLMPQYLTRMH